MENGVWYILAALIMGWTGFCIYKWIKNRKRGGCGCGCTGCPHSGKCDGKKREKRNKLYLYYRGFSGTAGQPRFFHKFMRFVLGIICYN